MRRQDAMMSMEVFSRQFSKLIANCILWIQKLRRNSNENVNHVLLFAFSFTRMYNVCQIDVKLTSITVRPHFRAPCNYAQSSVQHSFLLGHRLTNIKSHPTVYSHPQEWLAGFCARHRKCKSEGTCDPIWILSGSVMRHWGSEIANRVMATAISIWPGHNS